MATSDLSESIKQFHNVIVNSLSTDRQARMQSASTLENLKLDSNSTTILLQYIQSPQFDENHRVIAAQHSYTHYEEERNTVEDEEIIDQNGISVLQQNIVNLMFQLPHLIAQQFVEIISLMGKRFVQTEWPSLIPQIVSSLKSSQDPEVIKKALEAVKKICKKYRYMFRSDALYTEMNYMIENLSEQLLIQAQNCIEIQKNNMENLHTTKILLSILNSILHIIESILSQEQLPDFYEENLQSITQILSFLMDITFPKFPKIPDELIKCRSKAVRLVHMYTFKFGEYFNNYVQYFFEKIWEMVVSNKVPPTKQNEKLIQSIIRYLSEMSSQPSLSDFFKQNMQLIFTQIVLPNVSITEDDIEEYQDEPDTYIRNDLEESDTDTRRRLCMKFVQNLSKKFPQEINMLISNYVNGLLQEYKQNRVNEWIKMTTVLNLIITASITQYTYKHGALEITITLDDLGDYLEKLVLPEINQIPDNFVPVFLEKVADFLKSDMHVNQSYASATIEKLLLRKNQSNVNIFNNENMDLNLIQKLLQNVCEVLQQSKNLYAMRSLYRIVQLAQNKIEPFAATLGQVLGSFINEAAKEESQQSPNYTYILFETTALTLKYLKPNKQAFLQVEEYLTQSLNYIIQSNNTDMNGYAFQIYSLFVANADELKDNYKALAISILTNISNWEKSLKYLIPALAQFLIAMTYKHPNVIEQYTNNIQDIVKHLMSVEMRMENVALQLGTAVFEKLQNFSSEFLKAFLLSIFTSLHFYRNNTKSKLIPIPIIKSTLAFFSNLMINKGNDLLINACDSIQKDILFMILKSEGNKIKHITSPSRDKKYAIVAYATLLSQYLQRFPQEVIPLIIGSLIELCEQSSSNGYFQTASTIQTDTEDLLIDGAIDQTFAFQRQSYIALNSAKIELSDKLQQEVPQAELYFLQCLQQIMQQLNTSVSNIGLEQKQQQSLINLCNKFGLQIP